MGRELSLPPDDSLLAPLAALEAPSFAAAPAFQGPQADKESGTCIAQGTCTKDISACRQSKEGFLATCRREYLFLR